ncbi:cadherin domain-containing protein [Synechococcus sp. BIOS-E4-1]|uniref:cadherin domain-containing protein n=1 Tax=Synechococcus sp. BIOS-E4-1 TaxID=1400864 RepID=UPI002102F432|nr:cadherin domain-containing protein [Synechococcus sp. BIOS-E4-1]
MEGRAFEEAGNQSNLKGDTTDDWYGTAVCLSKDGSTMAVGVPQAAGGGTHRGQIRIYKRSGENWNLIDTINGTDTQDRYGHAVALSADGTILAIGASHFDNGTKTNAGHVRTFQYDGTSYTEYASNHEIKGGTEGEAFGKSVALSADGKVLVVGASNFDHSSKKDVGLVRIFRLSDSNKWNQEKWHRGDTADGHVGAAVDISADGDTVAFGGYGNTGNDKEDGRIYLYRYNSSKKQWLKHGRGIDGVAEYDRRGYSISISGDGTVVAAGSPQNDDAGSNKGRVDIYEVQEGGGLQPLGSPIYGEANDDQSGIAVSLSDNGKRVAIAAHLNDGGGTNAGHVRLYEFIDGSWQQQGIDLDGPTQHNFRNNEDTAISLSGDGTYLAIGSPASHDSAPSVEGTVRVLKFHDSVTPNLSSIQTSIDGEKIIVKFSENLSADLPSSSQFSVKVDGTTRAITEIEANGPSIELTLNQAIKSSDTNIQISYSDASGDDSAAVQDYSGNDASSFSNQSVTNLSIIDLSSRFLVDKYGNKFAEYGYAKVGPAFQKIDLNLPGGFSSPLVFSNVVSRNEQDPVATRLHAVKKSSFQVQLDEPKYYGTSQGKSFHTDEIISYFVIETGKHELVDEKIFLANSEGQKRHPSNPSTKSSSWSGTIPFSGADFSDIPVLFGQSQTHNGSDFITTRTKNVSSTGFQYSFQEAEHKGGHPAKEIFAWMAYSGGKSNSGGIDLEGQALGKVFTHKPKEQTFLNTYASTPFLLAGLRTFEGSDPAFSRVHNLNTSTFSVGIQEDTSSDGEVTHSSNESIHYLAIGTSTPPSIQSATESFAENTDTTSQVKVIDLQDSNTLKDESPDGEAISYSIKSGDTTLFAINDSTGVITIKAGASLDYETATSYSLTISAQAGNASTEAVITVNITPFNDNDVVLSDNNSSQNTVAENSSAGTPVGVTALGADADRGVSISSYALTDDAGGLFAINSSTGVVSVKGTIDYESKQSHTITVKATSSDSSAATKDITIAVTDVNDNTLSVADSNSATNTIAENATAGDGVGVKALGTDADHGTTIAYDFTSNPSNLFAIDASTGVITLAAGKALDFESAQSHTVTIRATSTDTNGDTSTASKTISINVTDVDDNALSVADSNSATNTIAENATTGDGVGVKALGTDADHGTTIAYDFTSNPSDLFAIDASTGVITLAAGKALDFESAQSHTVKVRATSTDTNGDTSTASKTISINVTDVDDNALSVADSNSATNTIAENATTGDGVGVKALGTDADHGTTIAYDFTSNPSDLFAIDASTGVITLAAGKALDFESAQSHTVKVRATSTDTNGDTSTASKTISINVTDVDDNALSVADSNSATNTIAENATTGDGVGVKALGTDADHGTSIAYDFTSNPSNLFAIDASTGVITLAAGKALDFESAQSHTVTVRATSTDTNGDTSTASKTISINVTDVDDNALSVADSNSATNTIAENATTGDGVGVKALGTDADHGTSIAYDFTSNPSNLFAIDASTGVITLAAGKALDFESAQSHTVTVRATSTDTNGDTSTASKTISINVTDVDDNALSVADSNSATNTIAENATTGDGVGVKALGTDADHGTSIAYDFTSNPSNLFAIDASTGVITLAAGKALDFESAQSHTVTVRATSTDTNSDTSTATKDITINVTDVDEFAPTLSDGDSTANTVAENATTGTTVGITAKGSDGDAGTSFAYAFASDGNRGVLFDLNATTGVVTLAGSLDYETATSHSIKVVGTATGPKGGTQTTEKTFQVDVGNINDNDPALTAQNIDVLDSVSAGTELVDLSDSNTSKDTDLDGDSIKYSITSGNESNLFAINETTGKISVATDKSLDYDKSDQHILGITATDSGNKTGTAEITIDVQDSNTAPNAVDDAISLNEDSSIDSSASSGIIQSNDSDAESDSLTIHRFYLGESTETNATEGILGQAINGNYGLLTLNTDGSYQYSADNANALRSGETAVDSFHYVLTDNKLTQTADIQFTINGINDAPYIVDATKKKKYTEKQGAVTIIDGSLDIVDPDDTDIESASIKFTPDTYQASEDQLGFTNAYGIVHNWNSSTGELSLTGSTSLSNYISALETVTYTNTDNTNPVIGERKIEWQVNDGDTNSIAITSIVDVGGTNDAPESIDEAVAVEAGSTISTESKAKLLANDTDPEGDSLTIEQFRLGTEQQSNVAFQPGKTLTGQYGRMTIESDGSYSYTADQTTSKRLLTGETRTETFTYTVSDSQDTDTGEIAITITGLNDSPVATNDAFEVEEDSSKFRPTVQGLLANDSDVDGDSLSISTVRTGAEVSSQSSNTSSTGSSSSSDEIGNTSIQSSNTSSTGSNSSSDEIGNTSIQSSNTSSTGSNSSSDETGNTSIQSSNAKIVSRAATGTYGIIAINEDGSYRYTANQETADTLDAGDQVSDLFTYTLSDGENTDTAEIDIKVVGVNDAPTLQGITPGDIKDQENSSFLNTSNLSGQLSGTDADASAVLNYGISGNSGSTASGNYGTLSLNRSTGAYEYIPTTAVIEALNQGESVSDSFELFVSDGSLTATRSFQVNITGANDAVSGGPGGSGGGSGSGGRHSDSSSSQNNINPAQPLATPSELVRNNDDTGFRVTGESGVWIQLEVLRNNSDWQNSLQIVNADGEAMGSIGATRDSTNMGQTELFLSGGSEIKFHQSSHNQKLIQSPDLQIDSQLDNSFMLHLEDTDNQERDYDDLSLKITTSQQSQNINAFKLASEQDHVNDSILNMTDLNPGATKLRLTLKSDCGDTNRVAFVKLTADDVNGFTVDGIASSDENTFEAAVRDSLINPDNTEILMSGEKTTQIDWTFNQADEGFYAPVFINQETDRLFTFGITSTTDNQGSIKNLGSNFFGYEDTISSPSSDWDFNDITMLVEMI